MISQEERNHYVYIWKIKDSGEVFYVGKGKNSRYKNTSHRSQAFKKIYEHNECEVEIICDNLTNAEACDKEQAEILHYKNLGHPLANHTRGGESGNYFRVWDDQAKEYLRAQTGDKNPNFGHHWTDEMKAEARKRMSDGRYKLGKNPKAQPIQCVETGEIFDCIISAMQKYNVKHAASFTVALQHSTRTAGGMHWIKLHKD